MELDKTQSKMLALSILGMAKILFGSSRKAGFVIDVLTDLVITRWEEGWDTYASKRPKTATGTAGDPFDALADATSEEE